MEITSQYDESTDLNVAELGLPNPDVGPADMAASRANTFLHYVCLC